MISNLDRLLHGVLELMAPPRKRTEMRAGTETLRSLLGSPNQGSGGRTVLLSRYSRKVGQVECSLPSCVQMCNSGRWDSADHPESGAE